MSKSKSRSDTPKRHQYLGLLVVGGTLTMPIMLVLLYFYVVGFAERTLQGNFIYPTVIVTLGLMELLEALALRPFWDKLVPRLTLTWRKKIARNLSIAFGLGCIVPSEKESVSAFLAEWAMAIPVLFALFCLYDIAVKYGKQYWRKRRAGS